MGLIVFHGIFSNIFTFASNVGECEEYMEIYHGILSLPHNTIMDPNNVMKTFCFL